MTTVDALPPALLGRCLRHGTRSDLLCRLATCTTFAKAMLLPDPDLTDPQLTVHVDGFKPALANVLRWAEESRLCLRMVRRDEAQQPASLQPLMDLLQREGVDLSCVRQVSCEHLRIDTGTLSALLPSLQLLQMDDCRVDEGCQPLSGCNLLQELVLGQTSGGGSDEHSAAPWHMQLASLPNLTALTLDMRCHPTSFLPLLASQLTHLRLTGYGNSALHKTAFQNTAQVTSLRSLQVSFFCTSGQLALLSALPQLQHLNIRLHALGDAAISALLQFPHLTSLTTYCMYGEFLQLQKSYTDQNCSWKELQLEGITPRALARLPLQSVSHLVLRGLTITSNMTADDIRAAVANVSRSQAVAIITHSQAMVAANSSSSSSPAAASSQAGQAAGSSSSPAAANTRNSQAGLTASGDRNFCVFFDNSTTDTPRAAFRVASRLRDNAPLVPQDITTVELASCGTFGAADAALVQALQQAMPPTITKIVVKDCCFHPSFWAQLATSFPRLKKLCVGGQEGRSPLEVMSYYQAASLAHHLPGVPQAADVEISHARWNVYSEERRQLTLDSFRELNEQLRLLGFKATVTAQYKDSTQL